MPAKVTLKVVHGQLAGKEFVFDERTTCIVGRDEECHPKIPSDAAHQTISRTHCLLDINPPDIRVRDIGSLNGTWVNGAKIGQRQKGLSREEGVKARYPEHDLKEGDEIKLGDTVFRVSVFVPVCCYDCTREIAPEELVSAEAISVAMPPAYRCRECAQNAGAARQKELPPRKRKVCLKCGKDVDAEIGERHGDYLCAACRADPLQIVQLLLEMAVRGGKDLIAIQGYTIQRELGRGGMGVVYLARHDRTGEQVALKVMLPRVAADERGRTMFLREVECTKVLKHPNVAELRDSGYSNGAFFFTLEFCDGGSVADLIQKRGGRLPLQEALDITLQSLDGLEYAHTVELSQAKLADGSFGSARGLVHRDLKPGNILLCASGGARAAKVADFGFAKAFDLAGLSGQTATGTIAGTPLFTPQPQVVNFKYARPDVDVWAMAASLYNMLTGSYPRDFPKGKDPWQVILWTDPVPILERDVPLPARLAAVIDEALRDKPAIRFKSAAELKRALQGAV